MDLRPSPLQQELIDRAYALAIERFAPRAALHDREASFPFDDYADLHTSGLLGLCVPEQHGGLGLVNAIGIQEFFLDLAGDGAVTKRILLKRLYRRTRLAHSA